MAMDDELKSNSSVEMESEEEQLEEIQAVQDDSDSDLNSAEPPNEISTPVEEHDEPSASGDDMPEEEHVDDAEIEAQSLEDDQPADQEDAGISTDVDDSPSNADLQPVEIQAEDIEEPVSDDATADDEPEAESPDDDIQESAEEFDLAEEDRVSEAEAIEEEMAVDTSQESVEVEEVVSEDLPTVDDIESVEDAEAPAIDEEATSEDYIPADVAQEDDGRAWYVVHCYSGYENKVRHNLEQRIETMGMKDKIFDVVVPTEEEIEVRDGTRRTVERRVFPGYILVNMILTEESWYVVRNTPGVTSFVGMGNEPIPLRPEEVSQIVKRMEAEAPRIKVTFKSGERVRIIDGPFNEFRGTVSEIDMERAKVRVMVNFFGRETPVELDFLQVEKA